MQQDAMQFLFDDADAKELAGELAGLIRQEFPDWTPRIENRSASDPAKRDAALTVAIVTLIVALPSGFKDSIDLAERIQLKKKIDKLLAWAKNRHDRRLANPFVTLPAHAKAVRMEDVEPGQFIDAVAKKSSRKDSAP